MQNQMPENSEAVPHLPQRTRRRCNEPQFQGRDSSHNLESQLALFSTGACLVHSDPFAGEK